MACQGRRSAWGPESVIKYVKAKWKVPENFENMWEGLNPTHHPHRRFGSIGWNLASLVHLQPPAPLESPHTLHLQPPALPQLTYTLHLQLLILLKSPHTLHLQLLILLKSPHTLHLQLTHLSNPYYQHTSAHSHPANLLAAHIHTYFQSSHTSKTHSYPISPAHLPLQTQQALHPSLPTLWNPWYDWFPWLIVNICNNNLIKML